MTLYESLSDIRPIPEVEDAVHQVLNAKRESVVSFSDDYWYEDSDKMIFEEVMVESAVSTYSEYYVEPKLILHISGMPMFSFYFFPMQNAQWWTTLNIEIPIEPDVEDSPSLLSLFAQSRFASLFEKEYVVDGIVHFSRFLDKDVDAAIHLISYYIRYYGYEDKVPDCIDVCILDT